MFNLFKKNPACTPAEAKVSEAGSYFIDVRTKEEFASAHARGAMNIPLDEVGEHIDELKKKSEVYVICRSGNRSAYAVSLLIGKGVNAINVVGGTMAWEHAGLLME